MALSSKDVSKLAETLRFRELLVDKLGSMIRDEDKVERLVQDMLRNDHLLGRLAEMVYVGSLPSVEALVGSGVLFSDLYASVRTLITPKKYWYTVEGADGEKWPLSYTKDARRVFVCPAVPLYEYGPAQARAFLQRNGLAPCCVEDLFVYLPLESTSSRQFRMQQGIRLLALDATSTSGEVLGYWYDNNDINGKGRIIRTRFTNPGDPVISEAYNKQKPAMCGSRDVLLLAYKIE